MNLVSFALRRPISLLTMVVAVALVGFLAVDRMSRDIFPDLGVPTIYVAQPYGGLDPAQMEGFIVNYYEYHFLYSTGIEHVESKSIQGVALIKLQFHAGTNMAQATAETVSYVDRARAFNFVRNGDTEKVIPGQWFLFIGEDNREPGCTIKGHKGRYVPLHPEVVR